MLAPLDRKLLRDLWHTRGQVLAIALVIAGGVAVCIMSLVNYRTLDHTREIYYREHQFADVFVSLVRAPERIMAEVRTIPGVARAESRIQATLKLRLPDYADPIKGRVVSVPVAPGRQLDQLFMVSGRLPDPRRDDEVVVVGSFADAHQLALGDRLAAIINGRWQDLRIVGIAESPESIYVIPPGSMLPDYKRFAILWMAREPLAAAVDMQGAFNGVHLSLTQAQSEKPVLEALDRLLHDYGTTGAYGRDQHFSDRFLSDELKQLRTMAILFPAIFMTVAMFLISVVVGRMVSTQRDVIAVLKAFGYSNLQVGLHFGKLVTVIVLVGLAIGVAAGLWLGQAMAIMYMDYFRFPELQFVVPADWSLLVIMVALLVSWAGAWRAVMAAVRLPPAEAMRPESPPAYRETWLERLALRGRLRQPSRMILRQLERKPLRSLLSVLGIALATAIVVLGTFQFDSVSLMVHSQFQRVQQADMTVPLEQDRAPGVAHEVAAIPGVRYVEANRVLPVRLHAGHRSWRTALTGLPEGSRLVRRIDTSLAELPVSGEGLLISEYLASELGVTPGDELRVEWLDGSGETSRVRVAGTNREFLGVAAYMTLPALNRLRGDGERVNQLQVNVLPEQRLAVIRILEERPLVAGVSERRTMLDAFYETLGKTFLTFTFVNALLGGVIAFGVIYNTVRISLAERGRELASLRVLGYRSGEVDHILLGELALLMLLGIPLGWIIGEGLSLLLVSLMQTELYRVPLIFTERTLGLSALVVVCSALLSALVAISRVARLDLVQVLKTRE